MNLVLRRSAALALAALLLAACGQTGPLVIPDKKGSAPASAPSDAPPPAEAPALENDPLASPPAPLQVP